MNMKMEQDLSTATTVAVVFLPLQKFLKVVSDRVRVELTWL